MVADGGNEYSRYYHIPRTPDDQLRRSALIEQATAAGETLVVLIKEIGTDALFGLLRVTPTVDAKTARNTPSASVPITSIAATPTWLWPSPRPT